VLAVHADLSQLPLLLEGLSTDGTRGKMPSAEELSSVMEYLMLFHSATLTGDWNKAETVIDLKLVLNEKDENSLYVLLRAIGESFGGATPF
jgi:hypothetical protein